MPEAGFAPAAVEVNEVQDVTAEPPSGEALLDRVITSYRQSLDQLFNTTQFDLSRFGNVNRDTILRKVIAEQLGQKPLSDFIGIAMIRQVIAEEYNNILQPFINESMKGELSSGILSMMTRAARSIFPSLSTSDPYKGLDMCFNDPIKFITWIDVLSRGIIHKLGRFSPPSSIIFEIRNVDSPAAAIKALIIWGDNNLDGMHRNTQLCIQRFPWIGRAALVMPEDGDENKRKEINELRELYVLAVIRAILQEY